MSNCGKRLSLLDRLTSLVLKCLYFFISQKVMDGFSIWTLNLSYSVKPRHVTVVGLPQVLWLGEWFLYLVSI